MMKLDRLYYDNFCMIKSQELYLLEDDFKREVFEWINLKAIPIPYCKLDNLNNLTLKCTLYYNCEFLPQIEEKLSAYIKKYTGKDIKVENITINKSEYSLTYLMTTEEVLAIHNYISKRGCYKIRLCRKPAGVFAKLSMNSCIYPNLPMNTDAEEFGKKLTTYIQNNFLITTPNVQCKIGHSEDNSTFALYFTIKDIVVGPNTMNLITYEFLDFIKTKLTLENPDIYKATAIYEDGRKPINYTVFQYELSQRDFYNLQSLFKIIA